ncbi:helix-turn-helix domain-containing protein [Streptomyces nitrosporeus]|uniref:helix-turn-helix domain-containing protein n=1 Tax=Streptomyces nitrosporeus TaxID=28894 RepID=UPI0039A129A7
MGRGTGFVSAPTVRRRQLGRTLRNLREGAGLTQEEVARRTGGRIRGTKVSRIETAVNAATAADVSLILDALAIADDDLRTALLRLTREGARRGWWQSYRTVLSQPYEDLISLESEAEQISTWQPTVIPGLLQTGEYARQIISATAMSEAIEDAVSTLVDVRLARQTVLVGDSPLTLWAIIGESALRTETADPQTMREQLGRLLRLGEQPTITIQVMPASAPPHVGQMGGFSILGYGSHVDLSVIHVESLTSGLYVEDGDEVSVYRHAIEQLRATALSPAESATMIKEIRDSK